MSNNITVNFVKKDDNIYLESLTDKNGKTNYSSDKPVLQFGDDGKYKKLEINELNEILGNTGNTFEEQVAVENVAEANVAVANVAVANVAEANEERLKAEAVAKAKEEAAKAK